MRYENKHGRLEAGKMKPLQLGIGKRIARLVALATFASVLTAATANTFFQIDRDIDIRRSGLESTAFALASAAGDAVATRNSQNAEVALTAISRVPDIEMAAIILPDGSTLASMGQSVYLKDQVVSPNDGKLVLLYKGKLPVTVDIVKGGEIKGRLTMVGNISSLRQQLLSTVVTTFILALLAAALGVFAARPLQRRIVGPLTILTQAIQQLRSSRDYSTNLEDDNTPDEAGVLVKAFNGLMSDIRFRDQALQHLAYNDPLTGLSNRVGFQRDLEEWLQRPFEKPKGAVALINIHGFRAMNDAFSHTIGDAILMTVAATMKSALREDASLARYGGDEFALLLRDSENEADIEMAFSRIQAGFFQPIAIGDLELHITLTAGAVTIFDRKDDEAKPDELLRHADLALADAKSQVPGRLQFFRDPMSVLVQEETSLGQALRQATKEGAFELHYQVQFDLQHNRVSGYEALVRWRHPEMGFISPAKFIPLAERIGVIGTIGDWVLAEGCRQAATWVRHGQIPRIMSINVSPAQILAAGFVEKVRKSLRTSGLSPKHLCLELTESMFVGSKYAETVVVLETLAKDGVQLSLG